MRRHCIGRLTVKSPSSLIKRGHYSVFRQFPKMPRHFLPLAGARLKNRAAGAFCLRPLSCCISFGNWRVAHTQHEVAKITGFLLTKRDFFGILTGCITTHGFVASLLGMGHFTHYALYIVLFSRSHIDFFALKKEYPSPNRLVSPLLNISCSTSPKSVS